MKWEHVCSKCGILSIRYAVGERRPVCSCAYHDPERCDWCGWCRNNVPWDNRTAENADTSSAS